MSPISPSSIEQLYRSVGTIEGRIQALESRQVHWEASIEKRLSSIETAIKGIADTVTAGQGALALMTKLGTAVIGVATIIQLIMVFLK